MMLSYETAGCEGRTVIKVREYTSMFVVSHRRATCVSIANGNAGLICLPRRLHEIANGMEYSSCGVIFLQLLIGTRPAAVPPPQAIRVPPRLLFLQYAYQLRFLTCSCSMLVEARLDHASCWCFRVLRT